jgi:hypothetical protein
MGKHKHSNVKQWHDRQGNPWPRDMSHDDEHDPPAWARKYLELADLMMKLGKKTEAKICRSKVA